MQSRINFTRVLAIAGTVLAGFPILMMVVTSIVGSIFAGVFRCDWLMPAELFLAVLAGGLLLLWAAFRARLFRTPVIIGLVAACVFLALSQGIALHSGIANGPAEPEGAAWVAIIASLALYVLAEIELVVAGVVLTRKLFIREENVQ